MRDDRGFSLIEALAAMALVITVVLSVATTLLAGRVMAGRARDEAIGRVAAQARLATLAALPFHTAAAADGSAIEVTDTTTDVAADPPAAGGQGLRASPVDALWTDRRGYVDYLDAAGTALGSAGAARGRAAYVRRWSIVRQGSGTTDVAAFAVLVAPMAAVGRVSMRDPRQLAAEPGVVVRRAARLRQAS